MEQHAAVTDCLGLLGLLGRAHWPVSPARRAPPTSDKRQRASPRRPLAAWDCLWSQVCTERSLCVWLFRIFQVQVHLGSNLGGSSVQSRP